ncbi:GNAT family N-acetyltransferase, partial [Sphingomonas sp.]|uniref:GNAT family N-acetyltransferase n=1 Tax=Sphingomonas sp. TaxID=28214 RepID=UPI0026008921
HADRFEDCSALILVDGRPAIIFPASIMEGHVHSHGGLTFGGLVVRRAVRTSAVLDAGEALLGKLHEWGARKLTVRVLPPPFASHPSQDAELAFLRRNFHVVRRDVSSIVRLGGPSSISKSKQRDILRAKKLGVTVEEIGLNLFYPLLADVLARRHDAVPVHSIAELQALQRNFPDRILVRAARLDGAVVSGAVLFRYDEVWHTQYLASGEAGRRSNALDLVIASAMQEAAAAGAGWFSFGTSMDGEEINEGLLWQKESFGGRCLLQETISGDL